MMKWIRLKRYHSRRNKNLYNQIYLLSLRRSAKKRSGEGNNKKLRRYLTKNPTIKLWVFSNKTNTRKGKHPASELQSPTLSLMLNSNKIKISSNQVKAWKGRKIEELKRRNLTSLFLKTRYRKKLLTSIIKAKRRNSPKRRDIQTFPYPSSPKRAIMSNTKWRINNFLKNQAYQSLSFLEK